jgi:hypothetical protein
VGASNIWLFLDGYLTLNASMPQERDDFALELAMADE